MERHVNTGPNPAFGDVADIESLQRKIRDQEKLIEFLESQIRGLRRAGARETRRLLLAEQADYERDVANLRVALNAAEARIARFEASRGGRVLQAYYSLYEQRTTGVAVRVARKLLRSCTRLIWPGRRR